MRTLPKSQAKLITFFEAHTDLWAQDPAAIGLDPLKLGALSAAAAEARQDFASAIAAREAAKAATTALSGSIERLRALGGPAISAIRAFAESAEDPWSIYSAAHIPPPGDPSPAPAPDAPTDIAITLQTDGALELRWKTRQPAPGAEVYTQIRRRLNGAGGYTPLGATGARVFIDDSVPAGTGSVEYIFTVHRGGKSSDPVVRSILLGRPAPAPTPTGAAADLTIAA